jgi:OOP family OmpA-OmpF porin
MNKNSKTIALLLAVAVSAALPLAAHAQSTTSIGVYAGVSAGQAEAVAYDCSALPACKKKGTVYRVFGGYQFSRNWALEVAFFDLGKVSSNSPTFDEVITVKGSELTLVGSYPATERFSIYGRVGGYYAHTADKFTQSGTTLTVKESKGNPTFGAGLQYFVTQNLALRGEGQRYMKVGGGKIGESNYNVYTFGLLWKFR